MGWTDWILGQRPEIPVEARSSVLNQLVAVAVVLPPSAEQLGLERLGGVQFELLPLILGSLDD